MRILSSSGGALYFVLCFLSSALGDTVGEHGALQGSVRRDTNGWIFVHVEGEAAVRGYQEGYLMAREIAEELRVRRAIWLHTSSMDWGWLVAKTEAMWAAKVDAEILQELEGMVAGMLANGQTATSGDLLAYNGFFELLWYWWPKDLKKVKEDLTPPAKQGCSSFIATGSMTSDGGIVLAHTTFFPYAMATARVVLDVVPAHGHRILMQTYPGWIHSGTDFFLTDAGLVGSETTIGGLSGFEEAGVPEFSRFRRATQDAGSIDEWCRIMREGNNGGYANAWLLGDVRSGEIARLELGLKRVAFEKKMDGYFVGSNIAEDLKLLRLEAEDNDTDIRISSVARRVRWKNLMQVNRGRIDVEVAKRLLADHYDSYLQKTRPSQRTLCAHGDLDSALAGEGQPFSPSGSFDGKVVDSKLAKSMSFVGRWGAACGTPFSASRFLEKHPQFEWMEGLLKDRPHQPWTSFQATAPALPLKSGDH